MYPDFKLFQTRHLKVRLVFDNPLPIELLLFCALLIANVSLCAFKIELKVLFVSECVSPFVRIIRCVQFS